MLFVVGLLGTTFVAHSLFALGGKRTLVYLGFAVGIPWLSEAVGLKTGFPFGHYRYSGCLGRLLPLGVPTYVVLAWVLLLYCSIFSAQAFSQVVPIFQNDMAQVLLIGLLMVAIDGLIDPVAVRVGHWKWNRSGSWFGVPATNYFGWFLTTLVTMSMILVAFRQFAHRSIPSPGWLFYLPILNFGFLNLHFIGLLRKIGLEKLIPLAILLAAGLISLYFFTLLNGSGN